MQKKAYDIGESNTDELAGARRLQTHTEEQQGVTKMVRTEPIDRNSFIPGGYVSMKGTYLSGQFGTGYWGQIKRIEGGDIIVYMNDGKTYRFKMEDADQYLIWLGNNSPASTNKVASSWYNKHKES